MARERSFGRAALALGYTQSAVSQQIAALERHVAGSLFDRPGGPKPVELTPLGHVVLEHADAILHRLDAAHADIAAFQAGHAGTLAIGTFQSVSARVLPALAKQFRADHPAIDLRLRESDDLDGLVELVRSGELEISFVASDEPIDGIHLFPLFEDTYILISPPEDAVSPGASTVATQDLSGIPLVAEFDSACQRMLHRRMVDSGVDVNVVFRTNDNGAISAMVAAGIGHAILPALAVRPEDLGGPDDLGVRARPVGPEIRPRRISLAWRAGHTLSPAAHAFIALAQQVAEAMIRDEWHIHAASAPEATTTPGGGRRAG